MFVQSSHKIKSIIFATLAAILVFVAGVTMDGAFDTEKLSQSPEAADARQKNPQFDQMKELDRKTRAIMDKAESLTKQADQLIAKTDLKKPTASKQTTQSNKEISTRLADVRGRLDALKK